MLKYMPTLYKTSQLKKKKTNPGEYLLDNITLTKNPDYLKHVFQIQNMQRVQKGNYSGI